MVEGNGSHVRKDHSGKRESIMKVAIPLLVLLLMTNFFSLLRTRDYDQLVNDAIMTATNSVRISKAAIEMQKEWEGKFNQCVKLNSKKARGKW